MYGYGYVGMSMFKYRKKDLSPEEYVLYTTDPNPAPIRFRLCKADNKMIYNAYKKWFKYPLRAKIAKEIGEGGWMKTNKYQYMEKKADFVYLLKDNMVIRIGVNGEYENVDYSKEEDIDEEEDRPYEVYTI